MAARSVMVTLRAEIGQYKAAMTEAAKSTKGVSEEGEKASKQGKDFVDNWSKASTPLLAVGGAITALGVGMLKTGIAYNQLQQQSRAALTTLLGSTKAANDQMDKLDAFARTSPFSKSTFIEAQQQMLAFGIETQKVIPYLDAIQDAVAASGGGNADIAGVVATMSKVQSSAKLTAEDLNELGNRGINAAELIGSQMGMTGAQIREEITAGALGADVALDALAAGMEERFDGAADNVKNTFGGALDRVSAAWRDLSSELAEPLVGKQGGGLFTALLNETADFMRAVQDVPGPVKKSAAALTGLTGVAALGAGAFLAFAPRIVATKAAIAELAAGGSRAAVGMQKTNAAMKAAVAPAAIVAGAFIAVNAAFELMDRDSAASIEDMTSAILDLAVSTETLNGALSNSRGLASIASGYTDLGAAAKEAHEGTEGFTAFMSGTVFSVFGTFSALNPYGDAMEDVKAYDEALAGLVSSGATEEAAAGFEQFAKDAKDAGLSTSEIEKLLPGYTAALKGAENETRIATESAAANTEASKAQAEALKKVQDAARGQAEGFINLGKSLNDSKVSLGDWIKELEANAKALEAFTSNAAQALNKGLDETMVDAFREAGPEGAKRLAQLADASEKEIARANKAWRGGGRNVEDYVNILATIDPEVITQFKTAGEKGAIGTAVKVARAADLNKREVRTILKSLDYSSADIARVLARIKHLDKQEARPRIIARDTATAAIEAARRALQSLNGDSASVTISTNRVNTITTKHRNQTKDANGGFHVNGAKQFADGGIDERGRSVPRVPQMRNSSQGQVLWGEAETNWEAYVSGKPGMEGRNRTILEMAAKRLGGVVEFADGGFTEAVSAREFTGLRIRVRDLKRSLKEMETYGKGKNKKRRRALRGLDRIEARQELVEAERELREQASIRRQIGRGRKFTSVGAYNQSNEAKENRQSVAGSFADRLDSDAFKSPASLERALSTMLRDGAEHTTLLAQLRKAGASPWLLDQLVKAGPSRATNRTARALLADTARLQRLNTLSSGIVTTGNNFAALTTGAGFTPTFSGQGGFSQAQLDQITRAISSAPINASLSVSGRQAGVLVQTGQQYVGTGNEGHR